jgi:hypothetical protein
MDGAGELRFLKKQTRAHKYLHNFTKAEIEEILMPHVPRLKSLHILTTKLAPPEVHDEYIELRNRIVEQARTDLQAKLKKKIKLPEGYDVILKHYMLNL